jgi:NAD(P)-dependent dehydrogenase (short-subunit alcohol dehydrogenase family)
MMAKVLVTGANRGIGLELCRQLKGRGDEVTAVCRSSSEGLDRMGVEVIPGVDVSDADSLQKLAQLFEGRTFDVLVNNAGILSREGLEDLDFDAIEQQFRINSIGPLRVTKALLGQLQAGSKIGIVTSRMGSIEDNTSGGYYGYRMSKAAVNMAGMCLARDLKDQGIAVGLLHPGMVATDMTGGSGVPVAKSAAGLIQRLDELNISNSGSFWHAEGELLPW